LKPIDQRWSVSGVLGWIPEDEGLVRCGVCCIEQSKSLITELCGEVFATGFLEGADPIHPRHTLGSVFDRAADGDDLNLGIVGH
jgi:hypothetical protein